MCARVIGFLLVTLSVASATTWPLIPFEQRWESLDIIAVVEVGPVHTVQTPEGMALQSAEAHIEKLIYRKHEEQPFREDSGKIRLYSVSPNGMENAAPRFTVAGLSS